MQKNNSTPGAATLPKLGLTVNCESLIDIGSREIGKRLVTSSVLGNVQAGRDKYAIQDAIHFGTHMAII